MKTPAPIIRAQALGKVYNPKGIPVKALDAVNLEIVLGEFTAIVGPSGCGKTTLLNLLGGLDRPSTGQIWIEDTDITRLRDAQLIDFRLRHIGFVFQAYNLIPVLTARENTAFVMQLQRQSARKVQERVASLLAEVGLQAQMDKRPGELSGGQQQRVAVARALASKPKFVLADEPTANLDSKSTENLLDIMARLNAEEGTTFIFSTHDARVIARARRVITLEDGRLVRDEMQMV